MARKIRQLKSYAKEMLSGNYGTAILGMVAYEGVSFLCTGITDFFFRGSSLPEIILGQAFSFILSLIAGIMAAGLYYMYLNMSRGKKFSCRDLLYFYKNQPDRVIVAGFVISLIGLVTSLPYYYVSYTTEIGNTMEQQLSWMMKVMPWMWGGMLVSIILTIPFSMAYYLLADNPDMTGMEALKGSMRMMKGNCGRYILMELSFVPLLFLSLFTFYIALLWLIPYIEMTSVMFYRDLRGEFDYVPSQIKQENY